MWHGLCLGWVPVAECLPAAGPSRGAWQPNEEALSFGRITENPPRFHAYTTMSTVFVKPKPLTSQPPHPADWTDEQLLLSYRKSGDQRFFSELVRRYERELYSYLKRYLGKSEMAEDAFQATFLQLHLKCDQFQEGRRLRPWLYMIATNKAIDLQRRNKRHQLISLDGSSSAGEEDGRLIDYIEGDEPNPVLNLTKSERGEWVALALAKLPQHLRVVVHLVYYQGLKYRETAEALSIPVGTVKSRLHAAIRKLTESWNTAFEPND